MADGGFAQAMEFIPNPADTRTLRNAFGRFATGITVVTADSDEGPIGITANSFSSLSLDPALVLWSPAKGSRRFVHFAKAEHFAIHVLAAEQAEICNGFAKSQSAFEGFDWAKSDRAVPLIENCLARFECRQVAIHPGGDHVIVVGQVERAEMRDGDALTFYAGQVKTLNA